MTVAPLLATDSVAPALPALRDAPPLAQRAVDALITATQTQVDGKPAPIEERAVHRPDSWLIRKCWEALADAGAAEPAIQVAGLAAQRHPLARLQVLHRLSRQIDHHFGLASAVARDLAAQERDVFDRNASRGSLLQAEKLLYAAATAANLDDRHLAFACLERLDQFAQPWDRMIVRPDQRTLLAEIVFRAGLHPLTRAFMAAAPRRFGDAGAQFLLEITTAASRHLQRAHPAPRSARMLALGVDTLRNAAITSLHGRRLAATVFAQAGLTDELLAQLATIANIQIARRESGLSLHNGDPSLLRQVKRPTANADVDFLVYTLREAVRAMPLRLVTREARIQLADQLVVLGTRSDGWTAASAAGTLVELGAIKYAVEVVGKIPVNDPARSEGALSLIRGLLAVHEDALADEQAQKALAWARTYPGRNPERAIIWGLAEVYLGRQRPDKALALLNQWQEPAGFVRRVRNLFGQTVDDDQLRNDGLRLRALLQQGSVVPSQIQALVEQLGLWAPRLLEGEALVNFLMDDMLAPLLAAGRTRLALSLLPAIREALRSGSGEKHAVRVAGVAHTLLAELASPASVKAPEGDDDETSSLTLDADTRAALEQFVLGLWKNDAQRGLWQTVHGIEGSLPLVIALEGPPAVMAIARAVTELGETWA